MEDDVSIPVRINCDIEKRKKGFLRKCIDTLGASDSGWIDTSGGTESDNLQMVFH